MCEILDLAFLLLKEDGNTKSYLFPQTKDCLVDRH